MKFFQWIRTKLSVKSPCCDIPMSSVFNMTFDKMVYTCKKCNKEWV